MINGELKSKVDKLWTDFWTGGIANPLTVIEQITFLMFSRLIDMRETLNEMKAKRSGKAFRPLFSQKDQEIRWSQFRHLPAEEMLPLMRDRVFPHFRTVSVEGATFGEYMKDAQLLIQKPNLLVLAVNTLDQLPITQGDIKGDLYEYLLSKLTTAGINGQFRTPRHIIRVMIELTNPKPHEVIGDPACGTGGFLVGTMQYLMENYTSGNALITNEDGSVIYGGDLLENYRDHIQTHMFHGFDFDATMLRIAAMNMLLHGLESPNIHYQDSLSGSFVERYPKLSQGAFDVILANPPFKGSLDYEDVDSNLLSKVKTKKTELLFVVRILDVLKQGGRSATIVPDGVLFGSSRAHVELRKILVDYNQLEAVISLPSGVFKPYAGVSTNILLFTKGGQTDSVLFYDVDADGFSLDDKRNPIDENHLPDLVDCWKNKASRKLNDRTQRAFCVSAAEIRDSLYELSINRYKKIVLEDVPVDSPSTILARLKETEQAIIADIAELESLL